MIESILMDDKNFAMLISFSIIAGVFLGYYLAKWNNLVENRRERDQSLKEVSENYKVNDKAIDKSNNPCFYEANYRGYSTYEYSASCGLKCFITYNSYSELACMSSICRRCGGKIIFRQGV